MFILYIVFSLFILYSLFYFWIVPVGFQHIAVHRAHPEGLVGRFTFEELCQRDVGAADYRAVAQKFSVVLVENIPRLNLKQHNEARRFITLVDELYEHQCALMCSAYYPHALDLSVLFYCIHRKNLYSMS